jgi:heat shock protein HslJ
MVFVTLSSKGMGRMIVKVAFLTIILSVVSLAVGQLLGQSSSTLDINKENTSPSGQEVRHRTLNQVTPESDNLFRSLARSLFPAIGDGQKRRRRKRLGQKREKRTNEERLAPKLDGEWVAISGTFEGDEVTMVKCITLKFDSFNERGPLALGFAGCSYYSGGFEATAGLADGISFKPLAWPRIACRDGSMEPESIYRQSLEAATSYEIDGSSLKISGPNGCVWVFRPRTSDDVDCQ